MRRLRSSFVVITSHIILLFSTTTFAQECQTELSRVRTDLKTCRLSLNDIEDAKDSCSSSLMTLRNQISTLEAQLQNLEEHEQILKVGKNRGMDKNLLSVFFSLVVSSTDANSF